MKLLPLQLPLLLALASCVVAQTADTNARLEGPTEVNCGLKTYYEALNLAFRRAAGDGEILVMVQVLPSFQREYAVLLKRMSSGVLDLSRMTFRKRLWSQLGPLHYQKTRQQCLDETNAAEIDTLTLPVPERDAESLWAKFNGTDLKTDSCPRWKGKCAPILDGTTYVVQTAEERSMRLSEISSLKDVTSENPALLNWVHSLLDVARHSQ